MAVSKQTTIKTVSTIVEFLQWVENLQGDKLLYRGLAVETWQVQSSVSRRLKNDDMQVFQSYINQLLDNARLQGFDQKEGRTISDLELLAELQHHGAATCLIDFTTNPLTALWFACHESFCKSGKVVAMRTDNTTTFSEVTSKTLKNEITTFLSPLKIWKWTPPRRQNSRIVAQNSMFVFGPIEIETRYYQQVAIAKSAKNKILQNLERFHGITENALFSDFTGFAMANMHTKKYTYSAEDYFHLGLTHQQRGEHRKALDYYNQAIKINPQYADAYNNRGNAKADLGDPQGAIDDYNKAIKINPQYADAYNNRGVVKADLGDQQGAIADYDKAIEINPQHVEAYNNRGNAKSKLGDHKGAIADYDQAIEINPQYANAYNNRGIAKSKLGDYQGAKSDFSKALAINPQFAKARNNLNLVKKTLKDGGKDETNTDK